MAHAHNDVLRLALERDGHRYKTRLMQIGLTLTILGALIGAAAFGNP